MADKISTTGRTWRPYAIADSIKVGNGSDYSGQVASLNGLLWELTSHIAVRRELSGFDDTKILDGVIAMLLDSSIINR
tara:strand:- start:1039 stop:1272 length:234 start_codon:yes stop_codon:yes gene_type:complete